MNLISLGIGKNQENYLRYLKNLKQNIYGIDKNINQNGKKFCKNVFKISIYPEDIDIKKINDNSQGDYVLEVNDHADKHNLFSMNHVFRLDSQKTKILCGVI